MFSGDAVMRSCIFDQKVEGDQYIAGPPNPKVGGDLSPPVPVVVAPMQLTRIGSIEE